MNKKKTIIRWRIRLILLIFLFVTLCIIFRLYSVQIINGEEYFLRAEHQHLSSASEIFDRGKIYFQTNDGDLIDAATIKNGYKIAINPKAITHLEDIYNNLGFFLDLDEEFYIKRAEKKDDPYEELSQRVPLDVGEKIKKLNINGVLVLNQNWRYYPGKELAAHSIGFTAFKGDKISGRYGLERFYENTLKRDSSNTFNNFFVEIFSKHKDSTSEKRLEGGIITTIDPLVQSFVEGEILNIEKKWQSKNIGIILMNPKNGEINSIALYPSFDLNKFNLVDNPAIYSNHLVENVYEMGSIMKPITMAIGLNEGVVTPETTYNDKGSLTLDTETIYNYDKRGRGVVSMQEVLNQSLNTGVAFVVRQLGNQTFAKYMKQIFATKTGIDLPNEAAALVANLDSPNDIEYATASFGQGIAISPINMIRALAILGNGGKLVTPHIGQKIKYDVGFSKIINYPEPVQILKPETSEEISRMLVSVVDDALRGGNVSLDNYSIAAKTGTAQIAKEKTGGYYNDRYLHSFFGYFPAYDPEFIIFLYHVEPVGARYASETLTEPFMNIVKFLINHYKIPGDRTSGKSNKKIKI